MTLLDLLYASKGTALYSLSRLMARVENLSYVLVWTTTKDPSSKAPAISRVELPRLKLTFEAKLDASGHTHLYSVDHADLYVSNARSDLTSKLLKGIPHSLILSNAEGELNILVPSINPVRPMIMTCPFTTELVLDRTDKAWMESLDTVSRMSVAECGSACVFVATHSRFVSLTF